jgi:serpin B
MNRLTGFALTVALPLAALLGGGAALSAGDRPAGKPAAAAVVKGGNEFAFDLYAKLRSQKGNQFFSPYSISTALAMTYAGARGQTADEMARTLHFTLGRDKLPPAFAALLQQTRGDPKRGYQLDVANALWGQKDYGFLPDFLRTTQTYYGAGLREVDFAATEQARRTINRWVEEQTHDKIKELIQKGILSANTRLVLTNAIYFKGDWAVRFDKKQTFAEAFHLAPGKTVQVPMMHLTAHFRYGGGEDFQALELPYGKGDLSMLVLLPKEVGGLPALEKKLSADWLAGLLGRLRNGEVVVSLPKFRLTRDYGLAKILAAMGMPTAFQAGKADFSGMVGSREKVFISAVIHKAFVDVNERGTEAAAATAVVVDAAPAEPPARMLFRADRPFVFLIRDNRTGSILFLGRVSNPKG